MRKIFPVILAGTAASFIISGCSGTSGAFIVDTEDNVIKIVSENTDGTEGAGTLTVGENEYVLFSPDLISGSVDVKFINDTGYDSSSFPTLENAEIVYEGAYSGRVLSTEVIAPGDYYVFISSRKADGSMLITTEKKDEYEKQNEELEKEFEKLNIELQKEFKEKP